ncbi:hypothetical protein TSOC_011773 [Tetrabaena socialis]|uniref:Uncharacterized protein n=1 Tax=Tetrabaena socialis TaxID=47790 RepID=A0A2J7ZPR1_9CHLO|nr:hypothetical protein TSOC_011773 [Tetrabaena socialis]|eukprot:PNH02250.1 hypothetical protein TSOC_011773 [Tetrabaena socialis]
MQLADGTLLTFSKAMEARLCADIKDGHGSPLTMCSATANGVIRCWKAQHSLGGEDAYNSFTDATLVGAVPGRVLQSNNSGEIELKPPSRGWPGATLLQNVKRGTLPPPRAMADFESWWTQLVKALTLAKCEQRNEFRQLIMLEVAGVTAQHSRFSLHVAGRTTRA